LLKELSNNHWPYPGKILNPRFTEKLPIVYSAVDKTLFFDALKEESLFADIKTLWRFLALHLSLSIQKCYQGSPRGNKRTVNHSGHSVLIFDNEYREERRFTDLLLNAPDWTDSYYDKKSKQEKLCQIIDVPHFVDSKDVGLIQLADFICFFLRKHIELELGYVEPDYEDEIEKVGHWTDLILERAIDKRFMYLLIRPRFSKLLSAPHGGLKIV
jgi:hypothetical protein